MLRIAVVEDGHAQQKVLVGYVRDLAASGVDEDYDKPASCLYPIEPPYFATYTEMGGGAGLMVILSGMFADCNCQVRNQTDFEVIPGLFAAGNCLGGRFPLQYTSPINGVSIAWAITSGHHAGEYVATLQRLVPRGVPKRLKHEKIPRPRSSMLAGAGDWRFKGILGTAPRVAEIPAGIAGARGAGGRSAHVALRLRSRPGSYARASRSARICAQTRSSSASTLRSQMSIPSAL